MSAFFRVEGLGVTFGGLVALQDVRFHVEPGQIFSVIGPNGAGKTTLFNIISGLYTPKSGRVSLDGQDVTGLRPHVLARRGLSRTFQNLQIFFQMTAVENVMVGRHRFENLNIFRHSFSTSAYRRQPDAAREAATRCLALVGLEHLANAPAASLPYGAMKRLEIARGLAAEPKLLLLDEPAAGCNPRETEEIDDIIRAVAKRGTAVVLIEHDMKLVMNISDRVLVLHRGRVLADGPALEVSKQPDVVAAYLGTRNKPEFAHA